MRRIARAAVVAVAVALPAAALTAPGSSAAPAASSASTARRAATGTPTHSLSVTGPGVVATYPAESARIHHYGIRTDTTATGDVTVTATTSDPTGQVTVAGRVPDADGKVALTGLTAGSQFRVQYDDALGITIDTLIYLPNDFPELVAHRTGRPQRGDVFVNVAGYATALDQHAVPVFLMKDTGGADFKRQPNGNYSTAVPVLPVPPGKPSSYTIDELDRRFHPIASHAAQPPLVNTDAHDSILEPNGNQVTISYEPGGDDANRWDAVIQEADSAGNVLFTWNSHDHGFIPADAYVTGPPPVVDYMHINSIQITADGDFLASFRNLSAVIKIARTAHGPYQPGDVIWQLGGKHSTFTFPNDPLGGPCAQHTGYQLPNGHILLFDDGAKADPALGAQTGDFCPDPTAPDPRVDRTARPQSRAVEYALDVQTHRARMVWSYSHTPVIYTAFAGSTQRLANGDTLVDWAFNGNQGTHIPIATEVNSARQVVWQLTTPGVAFSYRAFKFPSNDARAPRVSVQSPEKGARYRSGATVPAEFSCTDRGGSVLQTCRGSVRNGGLVDTTPGRHTLTVVATDHAGNRTVVRRHYTVAPVVRADASIRRAGTDRWVGDNRYGTTQAVAVRLAPHRSAVVWVRLQNDGNTTQRFHLAGRGPGAKFGVRYLAGDRNVSRSVIAGSYRTPALHPGARVLIKVVLSRTAAARTGDTRSFSFRMSPLLTGRADRVVADVRATR